MFSVGATPFNSRSRQLYGGWTLEDANAQTDRAVRYWAKKKYYEMASKFAPSPGARRAAKAYHTFLTDKINSDPRLASRVRKIGKAASKNAIRPGMTDQQRGSIFNFFRREVDLGKMNEPGMQQLLSVTGRAPFIQKANFPAALRNYYDTFTYNGDVWRNSGAMYRQMKEQPAPTITSEDLATVGLTPGVASAALNYQREKKAAAWGRKLDPINWDFPAPAPAAPAGPLNAQQQEDQDNMEELLEEAENGQGGQQLINQYLQPIQPGQQ